MARRFDAIDPDQTSLFPQGPVRLEVFEDALDDLGWEPDEDNEVVDIGGTQGYSWYLPGTNRSIILDLAVSAGAVDGATITVYGELNSPEEIEQVEWWDIEGLDDLHDATKTLLQEYPEGPIGENMARFDTAAVEKLLGNAGYKAYDWESPAEGGGNAAFWARGRGDADSDVIVYTDDNGNVTSVDVQGYTAKNMPEFQQLLGSFGESLQRPKHGFPR